MDGKAAGAAGGARAERDAHRSSMGHLHELRPHLLQLMQLLLLLLLLLLLWRRLLRLRLLLLYGLERLLLVWLLLMLLLLLLLLLQQLPLQQLLLQQLQAALLLLGVHRASRPATPRAALRTRAIGESRSNFPARFRPTVCMPP